MNPGTTGLGGLAVAPQMELNEPVSGAGLTSTIGGEVKLTKLASAEGIPDPAVYTIQSVTCDNIGEFVNGGSDLIITINSSKSAFTFRSSFLDLFEVDRSLLIPTLLLDYFGLFLTHCPH